MPCKQLVITCPPGASIGQGGEAVSALEKFTSEEAKWGGTEPQQASSQTGNLWEHEDSSAPGLGRPERPGAEDPRADS